MPEGLMLHELSISPKDSISLIRPGRVFFTEDRGAQMLCFRVCLQHGCVNGYISLDEEDFGTWFGNLDRRCYELDGIHFTFSLSKRLPPFKLDHSAFYYPPDGIIADGELHIRGKDLAMNFTYYNAKTGLQLQRADDVCYIGISDWQITVADRVGNFDVISQSLSLQIASKKANAQIGFG